jgi:hypothetical protein
MYFGDHNPPHFHVEFRGEKATINFDGPPFWNYFLRDGTETSARVGASSQTRTNDKLEKR